MSAASPGVISLFFRNDHYPTTRRISSPSPTRCATSTRRSRTPASCCSSTAPTWRWAGTSSSPTSTSTSSARRRAAAHRGAQPRGRATSRPSSCACTSAGATTRGRTTTTCRCADILDLVFTARAERRSRSRPPTRATPTSGGLRGREAARGQGPDPRRASTRRPTSSSTRSWSPQRIGRYAKLVGRENVIAGTRLRLRHVGRAGGGRSRRRRGPSSRRWPRARGSRPSSSGSEAGADDLEKLARRAARSLPPSGRGLG